MLLPIAPGPPQAAPPGAGEDEAAPVGAAQQHAPLLVHRVLSVAHRRLQPAGSKRGHAETHLRRQDRVRLPGRRGRLGHYPLGHCHAVGRMRRLGGQHELVPTVAYQQCARRRLGGQHPCRDHQRLVPSAVTVEAIDLMEVVQIEEDHAAGPGVALRELPLPLVAVGQTGHGIGQGPVGRDRARVRTGIAQHREEQVPGAVVQEARAIELDHPHPAGGLGALAAERITRAPRTGPGAHGARCASRATPADRPLPTTATALASRTPPIVVYTERVTRASPRSTSALPCPLCAKPVRIPVRAARLSSRGDQRTASALIVGRAERYLDPVDLDRLREVLRVSRIFDAVLAEGEAKGMAEGEAKAIVLTLRKRFGATSIPAATALRIHTTTDIPSLDRWMDLAHDAASVADFERAAFAGNPR